MGCCESNEKVPELPSEYSAGGCSSEYANIGPNPLAHTHCKGNELTSGDSSDVDTRPTSVAKPRSDAKMRRRSEPLPVPNPHHEDKNAPVENTKLDGSWSMEDAPPPEEQLPDSAMVPAARDGANDEPIPHQNIHAPAREGTNTQPLMSASSTLATPENASTAFSASPAKTSTHGDSPESDRRLSVSVVTSRMWAFADSGSERWDPSSPPKHSSNLSKSVRATNGLECAWHANVPPAESAEGVTIEKAATQLDSIKELATLGENATSEAGSSESGSLNSMDPDYGEQWARRLQKARPLNAEERDAALGRWLGNIVANLPPPRRLSQHEFSLPDVAPARPPPSVTAVQAAVPQPLYHRQAPFTPRH